VLPSETKQDETRRNKTIGVLFDIVSLVIDIDLVVEKLRRTGSDTSNVEAKSAAGGLPESIVSTMSALANLPGGGVILLGLDEERNFAAVGLADPAKLMAALASVARQSFQPPIMIQIEAVDFEGEKVIVAEIDETPGSAKPCRIKRGGAAYLRFWDGDYQLSELEIQGFLANRGQPRFDAEPVPGTSTADLDRALADAFIGSIRDGDQRFRRYRDDETVLLKSGVVAPNGELTTAGLLSLGDMPQQWFPNFVIQAAAGPTDNDAADIRIGDRARFSGPIPVMLADAINWVRGHSRRRVREDALTGRVGDSYDLPPVAVRELLSNALVHRDFAEWSWSRAIELRVTNDRLVLTNPGGLFGVSVDRLGQQALSSARNLTLLRICQFVGMADGNAVEALATGIPKILGATAAAGVLPPLFFDQALGFTAVLRRADRASAVDKDDQRRSATPAQRRVLEALAGGSMTTTDLAKRLGVSADFVRKSLRVLIDDGLVIRDGGPGQKSTTYRQA
jgi:ATP-dependent DNA helicase RecG